MEEGFAQDTFPAHSLGLFSSWWAPHQEDYAGRLVYLFLFTQPGPNHRGRFEQGLRGVKQRVGGFRVQAGGGWGGGGGGGLLSVTCHT